MYAVKTSTTKMKRNMKKSLLIAIAMLAITVFIACTTKQVTENTINLQLQNSVDSIVKQDMKEFAAQEGMVIVMETSTGNLRAVVGWKEDKGKVVEDTTLLSKARETFLFRGASCLQLWKPEKLRWTICFILMPVLMLSDRIPSMTITGEKVDMEN